MGSFWLSFFVDAVASFSSSSLSGIEREKNENSFSLVQSEKEHASRESSIVRFIDRMCDLGRNCDF